MSHRTLVFRVLAAGALAASSCAVGMRDPWGDPAAECAWGVCVFRTASQGEVVFRARNGGPAIATVSLTFVWLENLRLTDSVPILRTVPPHSSQILTRLTRLDALAGTAAQAEIQIDLGSDSTSHDPKVLYSVPFGGCEPRQLVAGYGSPTHLADNYYSMDFALPEGTPVLAAREGVVVVVQDGFTLGGLRSDLIERANLVAIVHPDATLASYGHLAPGLAVAVGDSVKRGQALGHSGSSGFSGIPHLHFHVGKRLVAGSGRTIPITLQDPMGGALAVVEGGWYPPAQPTGQSGSRCGR